ncbi:MAG TPA: choice-of-anchor D domain-containing protein, partial [Bacteroidota bacterium]|nr:choice-of-anchor D domain-containing protein [Bacteroidota bacterium]
EGSSWVQKAKRVAPDGFANDFFGCSVAIDSQYAIVGASRDDDQGAYSGSAYVYERVGETWTFRAKLVGENGIAYQHFGTSVSLRDTLALVGASSSSEDPAGRGSAFLFKRTGQDWTLQSQLSPGDPTDHNAFGRSVAIHGDDAIVGAIWADRTLFIQKTGAAYVYSGIRSGLLSVSTSRIDFGDVQPGDSAFRQLAITNIGFGGLLVKSIVVTGSGATRFALDSSPFSLAGGATRVLNVSFSPAAPGPFTADISIASDGGDARIHLIGKGSSPLSVLPDTLDFGQVLVAYPDPPKPVTIANLGDTPITIDSAYIHPITIGAGGFFMPSSGPFLLNPGATYEVQVTFSPQHQMPYSAVLRVKSDVARDSVMLKGSGYQVGTSYVVPDTLVFGDVLLGQWAEDTIYVTNTGIHTLTVGPITFSGEGAGYFSSAPSSFALLTGEVQPVVVDFRPLDGRDYHVLLHCNTNAGDDTVHLIGRGVAAGFLDVAPDTLHFGDWPIGAGASMNVYVRNAGLVDVHVGPITLTGSQAAAFSVDATPFTVSPQRVRRLKVGYVAQGPGMSNAVLRLESDGGPVEVPLDGNGIGCTPPFRSLIGPGDAPQAAGFGRSAGISGLRIILGSQPNAMYSGRGAAYIFGCEGNAWVQQAQLTPPDLQPYDYDNFGHAVAISGYRAIVGDPIRNEQGAAHIFTYQGGLLGGWELTDTLKPAFSYPRLGQFGHAVALDGDFAVVGAPNTIVGIVRDVGVAYIFRAVGSPGVGGWHLLDSLIAADANRNLRFGYSVDISNEFAIVGTMAWGAYIFYGGNMTTGSRWLQSDKLMSKDYQEGDYFGNPVAIDGDYALVAATMHPAGSAKGAVYVFKRVGVRWIEVAKITSPYPYTNEMFGSSIALSNDLALIAGLPGTDVYLFQRMNDTLWAHVATLDTYPNTGGCVAIDANSRTGVVGHSWSNYQGYLSGSALVFSGLPPTAIDGPLHLLPTAYQLFANYPNPFNASTAIRYGLPGLSAVRLSVFDLLGREVTVLVNERREAGVHEVRFDAGNFASGVYFCRLTATGANGQTIYRSVQKMMLMR